ncbi:MAG: DUF2399 domain-containing protein, partial [Trebonia sp.]
GRAHTLDDGSPLGTLAVDAARALSGLGAPGPDESAAEARREAWAAVGLLCDELSSTVLTLGLPGDASVTGQMLAAVGAGGEPVWLTLRQLVRNPPHWRSVDLSRVLIVENPSLIARAADAFSSRKTPIVCTNGQPRAATMALLRSLAGGGARLLHHGDFDWGGLTIGNLLHRRLPIEPWQFDRDAYLCAVGAHPHAAPLTGSPVAASWDPELSEAAFVEALEDGPGSSGRATLYTGARGSGKTVMLNTVEDHAREQGWLVISETATPGFVSRITEQHLPRLLRDFDPDAVKRRLSGITAPLKIGGATWETIDQHLVQAGLRNQIDLLTDLLAENETGLLITVDEIHHNQIDELREVATAVQHAFRENRELAFAGAGLGASVSDVIADPV